MTSARRNETVGGLLRAAVIWLIVGAALFPLYFLVVTSLKSQGEFATNYFLPPLSGIDFQNLAAAFGQLYPYIVNSVSIAAITIVVVMLVVVPAAYVFSWHQFPGKEKVFALILSTIMIPGVITLIPLFVLVRQFGLLDTHLGVALPIAAGGIAVSVYLLRTFFRAVPVEIIEAAKIDGASDWRILFRVIIPLSIPSLITIIVLTLVNAWNAYLWPLVSISTQANQPVSVADTLLSNNPVFQNTPLTMAGYVVSAIPLVAAMALLLRYFVRGVTAGAVKG